MSLPQDHVTVEQVPHGRTARRLEWAHLPPAVRKLVEHRLGSPVVHAESQGSGFTPGFASRLTGEDGSRLFVKAASRKAQKPFADAYAEEVRKLRLLPDGLPVPRLLWAHEDDLWLVVGFECIDGRAPQRPWNRTELGSCLDTLEVLADALTPVPKGMTLRSFAEDFREELSCWDHVQKVSPGWPHLDEAVALAGRLEEATAGDTLVHTDARDDNFLLTRDGQALLGDWNWPVRGAAWMDTALLLISAYGDGLDADAILAERRLTREVDREHIDVLLAVICGYFLERRDQPVPSSSPYIRVHARWWSEVTWAWLSKRRGWS
jgi:hypothetical protein